MKIVVAIDSFKGSLTAVQACETVAGAIRSVAPKAQVVTKPMADGGEGTASVLMATFTVFSHWYEKQKFGRISGLMIAVGNLGNLSATAPLALAEAGIGWRSSFLAIGVLPQPDLKRFGVKMGPKGGILVESTVGAGTLFKVILPVIQAP